MRQNDSKMRHLWCFSQNDSKMRQEWCLSMGETSPLLPHPFPHSDLVRKSFRSSLSFPNESERPSNEEGGPNDRNEKGNDLTSGVVRPSFDTVWPSFDKHWGSFQTRSCRSVKRGPCVIPSRSKIKRPCNEWFFRFGVIPSQKSRQVLGYKTTSEWQRNDIGMTSLNWNDSAMMQHYWFWFRLG